MTSPAAIAAAILLHAAATTAQPAAPANPPLGLDSIRASRRVIAVRVDEPIRLDGLLDDGAWRSATPATDFYQQDPEEFEPARFRTEGSSATSWAFAWTGPSRRGCS